MPLSMSDMYISHLIEIGDQIEQPLGYDSCDLDMGAFASVIAKELRELSSMPANDPSDFFFSPFNEPLAPVDTRSALELVANNVPLYEIEDSLKRCHANHTGISRSFTQLQRGSSIGGDRPAAFTKSAEAMV
jgi:hypothetical protein